METANQMVIIPAKNWQEITNLIKEIKETQTPIKLTDNEYIGFGQLNKSFNISRTYFDTLRREGGLPTYKISGKVYVKLSEIRAYFKNAKE